jgi:hypothetical protein
MVNTMMNTEMSSKMQHPLASDHKEISPDCIGSMWGIMNQKNVWLQKIERHHCCQQILHHPIPPLCCMTNHPNHFDHLYFRMMDQTIVTNHQI